MIKESFMEEPKFMFRLTTKEWILMRSQTVISSVQPIDYEENMPMRSQIVTSSAESADFQEDVTQKPQNEIQSQKKKKNSHNTLCLYRTRRNNGCECIKKRTGGANEHCYSKNILTTYKTGFRL